MTAASLITTKCGHDSRRIVALGHAMLLELWLRTVNKPEMVEGSVMAEFLFGEWGGKSARRRRDVTAGSFSWVTFSRLAGGTWVLWFKRFRFSASDFWVFEDLDTPDP